MTKNSPAAVSGSRADFVDYTQKQYTQKQAKARQGAAVIRLPEGFSRFALPVADLIRRGVVVQKIPGPPKDIFQGY